MLNISTSRSIKEVSNEKRYRNCMKFHAVNDKHAVDHVMFLGTKTSSISSASSLRFSLTYFGRFRLKRHV